MTDRRRLVLSLLFAALASIVLAQPGTAQSEYTPIHGLRLGDYGLNLPTTRVLPTRTWEVRFTHRFSEPINEGDFHSFWGLDSSADIGIGLAYSPYPSLQLAIFRSDLLDDYELSAKFAVLQQAAAVPVSVTARGGIDWRTEKDVDDRISPFVQLIVSRQMSPKLELYAAPAYVIDDPVYEHAFNVPVGVAWAWTPALSVIAEVIPENSDAPEGSASDIAWAVGLKRAIGGHWFEILLTDSRATHVDQYVGSVPLGGIDASNVHLGFNIERRFGGRR